MDPLTEKQQQLVAILELVRIEKFLPCYDGCEGRPQKTRSAIARSFVAKMVYNIDTTTFLLERLKSDKNLRRICGWESVGQIPSEATFSRAFTDFAKTELPQRAHKALIERMLGDEVLPESVAGKFDGKGKAISSAMTNTLLYTKSRSFLLLYRNKLKNRFLTTSACR